MLNKITPSCDLKPEISCQSWGNFHQLAFILVLFIAGASIVIITNTSKRDKVTDARTLSLMEERESLGCAVESMGGRWVSSFEAGDKMITHAIWIASDEDKQTSQDILHLSSETLVKLNTCFTMDIPVVSPKWLMQIAELTPGQHWSEVDVEVLVPRTIQLFHIRNNVKNHATPHSHSHKSSASVSSRRDTASSLSASISETYQNLIQENPDVIEEEAIKRAMELSMLDFAIVYNAHTTKKSNIKELPHEILQVEEDASPGEIKSAYRRRALETHPVS